MSETASSTERGVRLRGGAGSGGVGSWEVGVNRAWNVPIVLPIPWATMPVKDLCVLSVVGVMAGRVRRLVSWDVDGRRRSRELVGVSGVNLARKSATGEVGVVGAVMASGVDVSWAGVGVGGACSLENRFLTHPVKRCQIDGVGVVRL